MSSADCDVFLCHNSADKPAVEELARKLIAEKIKPWLDKWNLFLGDPWQKALESALDSCSTCAILIGPSGISPWQNEEMRTAISRRVREGRFRVIPVLLPGALREERSRLPTFMVATTWVEFRKSLDDEQAFHRLVCGIRGIEPDPSPGKPIIEGMRPYPGLKPFQPKHAPLFFGREALTEWLINELQPSFDRKEANRFLAIIGASGSGKSSLALAGLIPALQKGAIKGSHEWPIVVFRPGQDPLESLAVSLRAESRVGNFIPSVKGLISEFSDDPRTLHSTISKALHGAAETCRTFVLIDQFEEIFTLCQEDGIRNALIENMLYAASIDRGKTVAVLTMRASFYSKCASYETLADALSDHQFLVGSMTDEELRQAIQRPAELVGCELEDGLVEALINDFNNQPGSLPLLQHALSELWEGRKDRWLTRDAYETIGKLEGALENYANSVFEKFNENEQEVCRRIFLRLIQPGEGTEDTKRRAPVQGLIPAYAEDEPTFRVIQKLADSRLITIEGETGRPEVAFVEVAHEALIRGWSKLRAWIDSDRQTLRINLRLSDAAYEWVIAGHDESYLFRGTRLAEAEEFISSQYHLLNEIEQEFITASRNHEKSKASAALNFAGDEKEAETEHMTPLVFMSYAREDQTQAIDLYNRLKTAGFRPWIDVKDLLPGEKWEQRIREIMKDADFIVICLSRHSRVKRGYYQKEIKVAIDISEEIPFGGIVTIPVRLENCEIPKNISELHCVDIFEEDSFDKVVNAIVKEWTKRRKP